MIGKVIIAIAIMVIATKPFNNLLIIIIIIIIIIIVKIIIFKSFDLNYILAT